MPLTTIPAAVLARFDRIRCGLDVGFADPEISAGFRTLRGGAWMTIVGTGEIARAYEGRLASGTVHVAGPQAPLPFDDGQFDVAILDKSSLSASRVREVHRVLRPDGCLFFTVDEATRSQPGYTSAQIYNDFLKHGFDILSLVRPPWWRFGRDGHTLTVCARKKTWREHKGLGHDTAIPFGFRSAP